MSSSSSSIEPILSEENRRFTVFPLQYKGIWDLYQKQISAFWRASEVDFSRDYDDFITLNSDEQHFIKMTLGFFAASDSIVNFNISERFLKDVKIMEAQICYTFQMAMENVHAEVYSLMLDNIVKNKDEKEKLFNALKTVPSIKGMTDFAFKYIESSDSFAKRLIAFAIVEGVFFSGSFASIFWLKKFRGSGKLFMSGLIKSNEFIARDEGLHVTFACSLYGLLENRLPFDEVKKIIEEGVYIAKQFVTESLPCRLIGMNDEHMCQYIEYVSDRLLVDLGYNKLYNSTNPFAWMEMIGLQEKTNFFESRPSQYQAAFNNTNKRITSINIDCEDF